MSQPRRLTRRWIPVALLGASLLATTVIAVVAFVPPQEEPPAPGGDPPGGEATPPPPGSQQPAEPPTPSTSELDEFRRIELRCVELVRRVQPAIVGVISPSQAARPRRGQVAAGGIITADGLILSQLHVSHMRPGYKDFSDPHKPGEEATVLLADGRECKAKLLGASRDDDLSLLQLSGPGPYPFVPLQSDVTVRSGDWVVKLGHPLGFRKDRPAPVRLGRVLGPDTVVFVTDCRN